MKHLLGLFLARGMKVADLFWIGGGAVVFFFVAVGIGRLMNSGGYDYPEEKRDPWHDEPWI